MVQTVAVIDYGAGNIRSATKALEAAAGAVGLDVAVRLTADPAEVARAGRILLPGVGAFGQCMAALTAVPGLRAALEEAVLERGRPFLGICVGMQLLATIGLEHGRHAGLGWIPGEVRRLAPLDPGLRIPHMSWTALRPGEACRRHPALDRLTEGGHAYFVHSFEFVPDDPAHRLGTCDYGGEVSAVIGRDNILGFQFHPEKSGRFGLDLLGQFLRWRP